jgi:hypothetical protein
VHYIEESFEDFGRSVNLDRFGSETLGFEEVSEVRAACQRGHVREGGDESRRMGR